MKKFLYKNKVYCIGIVYILCWYLFLRTFIWKLGRYLTEIYNQAYYDSPHCLAGNCLGLFNRDFTPSVVTLWVFIVHVSLIVFYLLYTLNRFNKKYTRLNTWATIILVSLLGGWLGFLFIMIGFEVTSLLERLTM